MTKALIIWALGLAGLLTACGTKTDSVVDNPSLREVFGQWVMSREHNDWAALRRDGAYYGKDQAQWPRFDLDERGQLGLRSNYNLEKDSDNNYEFCTTNRIVWAPRASEKYRDFYVECRSTGIAGETTFHIFGAYDFLHGPPKMKYNFRIFGKDNRHLRYTLLDGDVYYFERVGD